MELKRGLKKFTTPVHEQDRADLAGFCDRSGLASMVEITPRTQVRVGGEVKSVRLVPRAGAPALEVTITDGRGSATAVFLGRRKIPGIVPGRKIAIEGVAGLSGQRTLIFNPLYTLF